VVVSPHARPHLGLSFADWPMARERAGRHVPLREVSHFVTSVESFAFFHSLDVCVGVFVWFCLRGMSSLSLVLQLPFARPSQENELTNCLVEPFLFLGQPSRRPPPTPFSKAKICLLSLPIYTHKRSVPSLYIQPQICRLCVPLQRLGEDIYSKGLH
jgi:hypothetical protein